MSRRISAGILTTIAIASLLVAAFLDIQIFYPWGIPVVVSLMVGSLLTWRVPSNVVCWLVLVFGSSSAVALGLFGLAAASADPQVAGWFDTIGNVINTAGVMALPLALLRFPNGSVLTPRWRLVEWVVVVAAVAGATAALLNGGWGGDFNQAVGIPPLREATAPFGEIVSSVFYPLMLVSMILASASLILRYRRSSGEERLKIKWLAYSGAFVLLTFMVVVVSGGWVAALDTGWQELVVALAFASVPAAAGLAVLQYRLYDIDVVINKTVVLAVLAAFITIVYAAIVVGLGRYIGGDGLALPIGATALVAVAFEPVRHRAQRWANRLVYGRRASPYEVLSQLTERLTDSELGEGLMARLAALLQAGTGAERATVWLGDVDDMRPGASWPVESEIEDPVDLGSGDVFPVRHQGEVVGALQVVKPRGSALSTAERNLISDLAGSAGLVLGYQRLNASLAQKAQELEESRLRLVEAQDLERKRLERDLHDGAQQQMVGLKVKIGLAARTAARHGAEDLELLLESLANKAQAALDEVRALAKGIYPPVLESDGLPAALSSLAASAPVEVQFGSDVDRRFSPDAEAAVYFVVSEAVTNAVKHAQPPIRVDLSTREGLLGFRVSDQGPGFDLEQAATGSGLENMGDRLDAIGGRFTISSQPGVGTTVSGEIAIESIAPLASLPA